MRPPLQASVLSLSADRAIRARPRGGGPGGDVLTFAGQNMESPLTDIARPWALMRHHAGWADVFPVETDSPDSVTGFYPDREAVGPPVTYSVRAVLARFPTLEAARAAREGAVAEWRKHDAAVRESEDKLHAAEASREAAWLACLREAAGR